MKTLAFAAVVMLGAVASHAARAEKTVLLAAVTAQDQAEIARIMFAGCSETSVVMGLALASRDQGVPIAAAKAFLLAQTHGDRAIIFALVERVYELPRGDLGTPDELKHSVFTTCMKSLPQDWGGPTPAPTPSSVPTISADYRSTLAAWLEAHKLYPESARARGEKGRAVLRFRVDRSGRVLDYAVVSSTGYPDLDAAVEAMMRGAVLPAFLPSMNAPQVEVSVTLSFGIGSEQTAALPPPSSIGRVTTRLLHQQTMRSVGNAKFAKPSFDCGKARTLDEQVICSNSRLAELDQAESIASSQAAEQEFKDEARAMARDTLEERHSCGDDRLCILDQQVNAINGFLGLGSQVPVPPWVGIYRLDLFRARSEPPSKTLPNRIAQCTITKIASISTRFGEELKPPLPDEFDAGAAISFANGGYQVSYSYIPDVAKSHIGDGVLLCLVSLPRNCPPGDERGKSYSATNLNTKGSWLLPDALHSCGGA